MQVERFPGPFDLFDFAAGPFEFLLPGDEVVFDPADHGFGPRCQFVELDERRLQRLHAGHGIQFRLPRPIEYIDFLPQFLDHRLDEPELIERGIVEFHGEPRRQTEPQFELVQVVLQLDFGRDHRAACSEQSLIHLVHVRGIGPPAGEPLQIQRVSFLLTLQVPFGVPHRLHAAQELQIPAGINRHTGPELFAESGEVAHSIEHVPLRLRQ